jgi:hypothetical protein
MKKKKSPKIKKNVSKKKSSKKVLKKKTIKKKITKKKAVKKFKPKAKKLDDDIIDLEDEDILEEDLSDVEDDTELEDSVELEDDTELEEEEEEAPPIKKKGPKVDKTKFYVEPKKFDEEIVRYYDSGILNDELAEMVNKIAHKLSYAPNFINYTYREDMVGDALIRMFKALMSKKYDREKGTNPFSYFTRIAFNAFRNRIKKEKHINETHLKYQAELMLMSETYNSYLKNNKASALKQHLND